jgi:hypothetical protein
MIATSGFWEFIFRIIDERIKWVEFVFCLFFLDRPYKFFGFLSLTADVRRHTQTFLPADSRDFASLARDKPAGKKPSIATRLIKFMPLYKFVVLSNFHPDFQHLLMNSMYPL